MSAPQIVLLFFVVSGLILLAVITEALVRIHDEVLKINRTLLAITKVTMLENLQKEIAQCEEVIRAAGEDPGT